MRMKNNAVVFYAVAFAVVVFITSVMDAEKSSEDQALLQKLENIAQSMPQSALAPSGQSGTVTFLKDNQTFSEVQMHREVDKIDNYHHSFVWGRNKYYDKYGQKIRNRFATYSSQGTDLKQHFSNSFLVGIHPFKVANLALPLYSLAQRKTYQYDKDQYGREEVWQNSAQAFVNLRGDCEDHALALADWLISEGVDAKVVVGSVPEGGHAWVVATIEGREYLLEATSKRRSKSWKHYPLASMNTDYLPEFMFNRTQFWVNIGSQYTTQYSGPDWLLTSHFERD